MISGSAFEGYCAAGVSDIVIRTGERPGTTEFMQQEGSPMSHTYRLRPPVAAESDEQSYWIKANGMRADEGLVALQGDIDAQIVIVGGGFTGLWTAWRILELDPRADVVIVEADFCGSGASGRNGGHVHTWFGSLDYLRALVGRDEAIRLARATRDVIDELQAAQESGVLDMDLRLNGFVNVSIAEPHDGGWTEKLDELEELGERPFELMDRTRARRVSGTTSAREGVIEPFAGTMDPFKLVRSLRDSLVDRGVRIFEQTPVTALRTGSPARITTPAGAVTAQQVLLATCAWAGSIPQVNQAMYTVDGQVVATEPIPELLDQIGLEGGRAISDSQMQVLYLQRTVDDRLLLGQGSGLPVFKDRLGKNTNHNPRLQADVTAELRRMYPELAHAKIDYAWAGPIDISASHLPIIDTLKHAPNVMFCVGWTGTALAQIPVVARMLAAKLLGIDDEWSRSPLVDQSGRITKVFPEPFRYIGANIVRKAVQRRVVLEREGRRVGWATRALISLMPRYREPAEEYMPDKRA